MNQVDPIIAKLFPQIAKRLKGARVKTYQKPPHKLAVKLGNRMVMNYGSYQKGWLAVRAGLGPKLPQFDFKPIPTKPNEYAAAKMTGIEVDKVFRLHGEDILSTVAEYFGTELLEPRASTSRAPLNGEGESVESLRGKPPAGEPETLAQAENLKDSFHAAVNGIVACPDREFCTRHFQRYGETPQFRPLGRSYARYRIAVVSENPGGYPGMGYSSDARLMERYRVYANDPGFEHWEELNSWLLDQALRYFGKGRYVTFLEKLGISSMDHVAHLTAGCCRTRETKGKKRLCEHCFERHTAGLLTDVLHPGYVITVGSQPGLLVAGIGNDFMTHVRQSMHWSQKSNSNRERCAKRQEQIAADLRAYMNHMDQGGRPETFVGDASLARWPH